MPELPEVEVTRLGLAGPLQGAQVRAMRLGKPLRWPLGCEPASLAGMRIGALQRRGKYLWMPLSGLGREGGLLWHLGMSGSLSLSGEPPPRGPHDHVELETSAGTLRLNDPRRFGAVEWSEALGRGTAARRLARLGMEPFDAALDANILHDKLRRRRGSVKSVLLAGDVVVGAGNIYACEALFRSGIDPRARCDRLSRPGCQRLLDALRQTLRRAIEVGGSTLRDFRDVHGASGAFQSEAMVYGREGQPCPRCGGPVRRVAQQQRSSYFCPRCQRR